MVVSCLGGDDELCLQQSTRGCGAGVILRLLDHPLCLLENSSDIGYGHFLGKSCHLLSPRQGSSSLTCLPLRVTVSWKWSKAAKLLHLLHLRRRPFPPAPTMQVPVICPICTVTPASSCFLRSASMCVKDQANAKYKTPENVGLGA